MQVLSFNSKLVRLKVDGGWRSRVSRDGFNSKLVRLKVGHLCTGGVDFFQFQFQTGAIKSDNTDIHVIRQRDSFNSKLVRLKGLRVPRLSRVRACFNSKLVRLKVPFGLRNWRRWTRFNSKLVRLKGSTCDSSSVLSRTFQFQTGAIKSDYRFWHVCVYGLVSIPNWCD